MTTIEARHIQATIDFIESKIEEQRTESTKHGENLSGWYEGRADAFEDIARWLKRDLSMWEKVSAHTAA